VTLPSDPLEALNWAWSHSDRAWWVIGLIAAGIAWSSKRMREWNRRNAPATVPGPMMAAATAAKPAAASASVYAAAPSYAAAGYTAQPAYAAPTAAPKPPAPSRKLHRDGGPAQQRAATPAARSMDVPPLVASGRWTLSGAFGDPAHARTAIVVAEVLGPPVGLR
jgi:hypothetical protein